MARALTIGTRSSRLALAQTALVIDALHAVHPDLRITTREITTQGDRDQQPLSQIGGQGVFTKAIEDALLRGEVDAAVHSMKDLPPESTEGLTIAAVPARADARDALVTASGSGLDALPPGARVGTGSARRAAQLKALRPDLVIADIRGNVDTRLRKLDAGDYDALVLATAGLARLGLAARASHVFSIDEITPSPGQGALAVQARDDDAEARALLAAIDDRHTRIATKFERALLAELGAGCALPVAAHAGCEPAFWWTAMLQDEDGVIRRARGAGLRVVTAVSLRHYWRRARAALTGGSREEYDDLFYLEEQMPRIAAHAVAKLYAADGEEGAHA